jgi:hypothetical protein
MSSMGGTSPIATVAPYTTGTVAFVQGSASIVGTGTAWTAAMTGRKIATAIGGPWYRFTYVSATTGTLAQVYAEASNATSSHIIFQDEFDLPVAMEVIKSANLLGVAPRRGDLGQVTEEGMDARGYVHGALGPPLVYAPTLVINDGFTRIRVYPIPDTIYRIRVRGLRSFKEMTSDADLPLLGPRKEQALILATCLEAQRRGDGRAVTSDAEVEKAITDAWRSEEPQQPLSVTRSGRTGQRHFTFFMRDPT